ncbi:MAG TPA: hypothetical protein VIK78_22205 [Ruminiclostridium sp.]
MFLKFFTEYPHVVYSIIGWGYIFAFIRLKDIKRLFPIGILSGLLLFGATYWLVSLNLYKFNNSFLPILGIPFFYALWGTGSGIIFAYYFGEKPLRRFIIVLGFAGLVVFMESLAENVKSVEHVGKFNNIYEYVFNVMILSVLAFVMTNLYESRLRKVKNH